jgi:DNA-binding MarR family transcriptional regulator
MNPAITNQDDIPIPVPALLRAARRTYGAAIRAELQKVGCDDMPHNGIYVVGGIARNGPQLSQLIRELGVSKQAASQLLDTLAARGYIERFTDPADRRRMHVSLTERGEIVAKVSRTVIEQVDTEFVAAIGEDGYKQLKYALAVLIDINDKNQGLPRGIR